LSNGRNRKERIKNVKQRYHAAVNPHSTIVPLLEHVVAIQPQNN